MNNWHIQRLPNGIFLVIFAALYSIAQITLYLTDVTPLLDYPNHLARMHILLNIAHSYDLQRFYEIQWAVIPNLAMDFCLLFFCHLYAIGVYGLAVISYEFARTRQRRESGENPSLVVEWTPVLAQFVIPVILLGIFSPVASDISDIRFARFFPKIWRPYDLVNPYQLLASQVVILLLTGLFGLSVIKRKLILVKLLVNQG